MVVLSMFWVSLLTAEWGPVASLQCSALACSGVGQTIDQLLSSWACLPKPRDPGGLLHAGLDEGVDQPLEKWPSLPACSSPLPDGSGSKV